MMRMLPKTNCSNFLSIGINIENAMDKRNKALHLLPTNQHKIVLKNAIGCSIGLDIYSKVSPNDWAFKLGASPQLLNAAYQNHISNAIKMLPASINTSRLLILLFKNLVGEPIKLQLCFQWTTATYKSGKKHIIKP